jgi:hypothetical protein
MEQNQHKKDKKKNARSRWGNMNKKQASKRSNTKTTNSYQEKLLLSFH